jgi:hypothetical protein
MRNLKSSVIEKITLRGDKMRTVIGLYENLNDVEKALEALSFEGFPEEDISLVAGDGDGKYAREIQGIQRGDEDMEDSESSRLTDLVPGVRALKMAYTGQVIAYGPLLKLLELPDSEGLTSILINLGIPKIEAEIYSAGVRASGVLLVVNVDQRYTERAATVMNRYNPINIDTKLEETYSPEEAAMLPVTGASDDDVDLNIPDAERRGVNVRSYVKRPNRMSDEGEDEVSL